MAFWQKAVLLMLRLALGAAILVTFATLMGVGIARQAALGGGFSVETREALTQHGVWAWARTGGPVALAALALAGVERWLAGRWGGA